MHADPLLQFLSLARVLRKQHEGDKEEEADSEEECWCARMVDCVRIHDIGSSRSGRPQGLKPGVGAVPNGPAEAGPLPVSEGRRPRARPGRPRDSRRDAGATLTGYGFAPPRAAVARLPPRPMVSTADEGTMTSEPRSLMASCVMFMARRCSATGFSAYEFEACTKLSAISFSAWPRMIRA